jgi:hypothetical protein
MSPGVFAGFAGYISPECAAERNAELDCVLAKYEAFLRRWPATLNEFGRIVELKLALENAGTAPGDDVDVRLTTDAPRRGIEEMPELPQPPELPKRQDPFGFDYESLMPRVDFANLSIRRHDDPLDGPNISDDPDEQSEVHWTVRRVKHHVACALPVVYFQFSSTDDVGSFNVSVRLIAANIRKPKTGALHVEITRAEPRQPPDPLAAPDR